MHDAAFNCASSVSLMPGVLEFHHFYTEKIAINIYQCTQIINSIKFSIQIQFGVFLRGHFGTPIDTAPVLLSGILCSTSHFLKGLAAC